MAKSTAHAKGAIGSFDLESRTGEPMSHPCCMELPEVIGNR